MAKIDFGRIFISETQVELIAYQTVLNWFQSQPFPEAIERLHGIIAEKREALGKSPKRTRSSKVRAAGS